jgi:hypothetical protein
MSTIQESIELRRASAKRRAYSPLEAYWNAFQEWRERERLRTPLCPPAESELADTGKPPSENHRKVL